jgi:hypothetical protein
VTVPNDYAPIICLEGPSAVGKTTLGNRLAARYSAPLVDELDATDAPPIGQSAEWFVDAHARRWQQARALRESAPFAVMDCDPLKGLWYNWMHAEEGWERIDVLLPLYAARLSAGTIGFPDLYVVLDADVDELRVRRANDASRRRDGFEKHMNKIAAQRRYFAALQAADVARVVFVDATDEASLVDSVVCAVNDLPTRGTDQLWLLEHMTEWVWSNSPSES